MHRVSVKICGITDQAGLTAAVEHGANAVGFVFTQSPRQIDPAAASALIKSLPVTTASVAVFRRPTHDEVLRVSQDAGIRWVQVDNDVESQMPTTLRVMPVFRIEKTIEQVLHFFERTFKPCIVEGARSGVGEVIDWSLAAQLARKRPLILAGGLTPENVAEAIRTVRPCGVDVSSGVESSPGKKDPIKIRDFLQAVRDVDRELQ